MESRIVLGLLLAAAVTHYCPPAAARGLDWPGAVRDRGPASIAPVLRLADNAAPAASGQPAAGAGSNTGSPSQPAVPPAPGSATNSDGTPAAATKTNGTPGSDAGAAPADPANAAPADVYTPPKVETTPAGVTIYRGP
jgi:hypothetical protein